MYKAAVRWQIRRSLRAVNAGNPEPQVKAYAPDAILIFPGISRWSGQHSGRDAIAEFLHFVTRERLQFRADDILVNGPPWRTRVAIVATVTDASGGSVYTNRAAMYAQVRWGQITYQEDYEDTHHSQLFDEHLKNGHREVPTG